MIVFLLVCWCVHQTGIPDDHRHPGHPAAPPEADCRRSPCLQHRHLRPWVPERSHQGPAGVGHPDGPQPQPGSASAKGTEQTGIKSNSSTKFVQQSRKSLTAAFERNFTSSRVHNVNKLFKGCGRVSVFKGQGRKIKRSSIDDQLIWRLTLHSLTLSGMCCRPEMQN